MYIRDWINKLDEYLRISERDILTHAGAVSYEGALEKAHGEYEKYKQQFINEPSPVERHFMEVAGDVKKLERIHKPRSTRKKRK
jgi:hypothetical protein